MLGGFEFSDWVRWRRLFAVLVCGCFASNYSPVQV